MSFTKNDQAVVLNRESLQYLANCIRLVHSLPDLLNDVLPSQTTTYSSYKVTELLNTLNTDLQNYVNNALGNLSHLKKEIVSVAPTDSSADEDTIYLVQDASGGYEQYLKINGVVTSLGSTSAINNVYTKTESDSKFGLLSTLNSLITVVGGLNDLTTTDKTSIVNAINELKSDKVNRTDIVDNLTSTDTDKPLSAKQGKVLKGEVDLKANKTEVVKKTDITTTIDSTSTDTQVPSASAIYHKSKNGITEILTNNDIIAYADTIGAQMVTDTVRIMNGINSPYGADNISNDFHYTIYNINNENFKRIVAYDVRKNDMYMIIKRNGTWSDWKRVCTTNVADVPVTNIAPSDTTTFINFKGNSNCNYCVKNGICYVSLWGVKIASTGGTIKPGVILPKCANNRAGVLMTGTGDATEHAFVFILDNGELCFDVKDANIELYGSFSYPVAEQ